MAKTKTLTQSIYRAFERILTIYSDEKSLKGEQADLMMDLSQELADGFKDWLLKQPFRIQKMKAILEVEDFQTTGPRFADVMPTVQTTVPPGVAVNTTGVSATGGPTVSQGATNAPALGTVTQGKQGVMLPKLTLKKAGGQGGILKSKGYAYIGNNPVGETNERKTEVRLMKQDVKDL